jgi:hypothetical protein
MKIRCLPLTSVTWLTIATHYEHAYYMTKWCVRHTLWVRLSTLIVKMHCHKFRKLTIGQNCSAVCTNEGDHIEMHSWREAPCASRGLPLSLEWSKRRDLCFVMSINSLVMSTLFSGEVKQLLLACSEGCGLHNNRFKVRAAFICTCTLYYLNRQSGHAAS